MKKLAIFLAIMLIPFSAFALDTISDSDLDSVTGQAGVSIFTNSIQIVKTGVTTTYTDSNGAGDNAGSLGTAGSFTVVNDRTMTQIFFLGYDPINIDVVDKTDAVAVINEAAGAMVMTQANYDLDQLGDSGVQITLPNAIVINNILTDTTYYTTDAAQVAADITASDTRNELINIKRTGGTTTISLAYADLGSAAYGGGVYLNTDALIDGYLAQCEHFQWNNVKDDMVTAGGTINHADQIKILITAHE